jgi:hypothetical protein
MHFAAQAIPSTLYARILALVMFGDPGNRGKDAIDPLGGTSPAFPSDLAAKLRENCAHSDPVCTNNGTTIDAHLSYNNNGTTYMVDSAMFIHEQHQTGGKSGAQPAPESPGAQTEENIVTLQSLAKALGGSNGTVATCNGTATNTTTMTNATASRTGASITTSTMSSDATTVVSM